MRKFAAFGLFVLLSGCALPQTVQRIGVEYNSAVAGMADELALLNIVRAKEGMPLHYTSVSRLSGSVTLKATGGLNEAIKFPSPVATNSTQATTPAGSTIPSTVQTTAQTVITSGGNVLTPSVGGEVDTGPSFDIAVLDSQTFYNGILAPVPVTTIANFIAQGYDSNLLLSLFAIRIDFRLKGTVPGYDKNPGDLIFGVSNTSRADRDRFAATIKCFTLVTSPGDTKGADLMPLSRITTDKDGRTIPLQLKDVATLDGVSFGLSKPITKNPADDGGIYIIRPPKDKQSATLVPNGTCVKPQTPPEDVMYVDQNKVMVAVKAPDGKTWTEKEVDPQISITFRSTEGAIRYLGNCLAERPAKTSQQCVVGNEVLFALREGSVDGNGVLSAHLLGTEYYVPTEDQRRSFQTLALLEQLISLQQSAADKPITLPVQVVN